MWVVLHLWVKCVTLVGCITFVGSYYIWGCNTLSLAREGGEFDVPQHTWGGAFVHNTREVGNLIRCLDFMFCATLRIKTARLPSNTKAATRSICNHCWADISHVRHHVPVCDFWNNAGNGISAQTLSDFRSKSGPEVAHLTTEFSLEVGYLNGFLAPGWVIWPQLNWKVQMGGGGGGGCASFELIGTLK